MYGMEFLSFFSVSFRTPSFASRVDVEPFNSTTVGSEVAYQCQSGLQPEGRMTSVCSRDGRWNPDPATLMCKGKYVCMQSGIITFLQFYYAIRYHY